MHDHNNIFGGLAAILAPFLVQELAKLQGGAHGNPIAQGGGAFQPAGGFPQQTQPQPQQYPQPSQAQTANPFGAPNTAQQQAATVTPDMIQTLITPMVQNEQVKAALTGQMQQMGIQNLPDARPDQLAELYQRFQTVEQQAKAAGLLGGTTGAAPSII